MFRPLSLLLFALLTLAGCGQDLHFKINYTDTGNLAEGDPLVLDNRPIGKVVAVEPAKDGGRLVEVAIPRESTGPATSEASFILSDDPDRPQRRRIELQLAGPGGKPIADGAVVAGSYPNPLGGFPFGELLRGFGDALRGLSGQVEQFRREFEKLPNSPEAKQLQQEWRRLTDEITKAQGETSELVKKDILPKLEQEMDGLRKRLDEEAKKARTNQPKPLES
jgi:hypothetical protein